MIEDNEIKVRAKMEKVREGIFTEGDWRKKNVSNRLAKNSDQTRLFSATSTTVTATTNAVTNKELLPSSGKPRVEDETSQLTNPENFSQPLGGQRVRLTPDGF